MALTSWVGLSSALAESGAIAPLSTSMEDVHITVLAGSCAACHGTNGNALAGNKVLAGMSADEFVQKMLEFRTDKRNSTVMHRHAKGLTEEEITQLAVYFSNLKPQSAVLPKRAYQQGQP